jgi:HEAT repeats
MCPSRRFCGRQDERRSMRKLVWCVVMALAGCGSSIHDSTAPGPVEPGLYGDATLDNKQRLAGEDVRIVPLYRTPLEAVGVGFATLIGDPIAHFFDYITHDNGAFAARKMEDPKSPDNQREGMLRLTDFEYARRGIYLKGYAILARNGGDFTVRAAGLRALNRCRAQGYTVLFMESLNDDQSLIRLEAADALANIPDAQAVPLLLIHMGTDAEPSVDVRIACAEALRNFHTTEVMHALVDELDDQEFGVAWQARQSLELLTGQDFRYDSKGWLNYLANTGT